MTTFHSLPHIIIPHDQWPRENVYYFCPDCREVFGIPKMERRDCPSCGHRDLQDIFVEIAERLEKSWSFFEATRVKEGSWLFANEPGGEVHHMDEGAYTSPNYPLAYYAELRGLGFVPPWLDPDDPQMREKEDAILRHWIEELKPYGLDPESDWIVRNRLFMYEQEFPTVRGGAAFEKSLAPGGVDPNLTTMESALGYFNSLPWVRDPYSACGRIGHALDRHMALKRQAGEDDHDDVFDYVKDLIDAQYQERKGYWGGQESDFICRTSGNMKIMTLYARHDWPIPEPKAIIDYHLGGATDEAGFEGGGCEAFNQMFVLCAIYRQYPELRSYRGDEVDHYTSRTFITFLNNWDDETSFYGKTWLGKHNNGRTGTVRSPAGCRRTTSERWRKSRAWNLRSR